MRNILNISLPEEMAKIVAKGVRQGRFASTSEYIRHLIRTHELAEELRQSRKELRAGKGKLLGSLRDLR